jgi:hypothetical protein
MLLPEWVWPVAVMTALGGFIDFLLGNPGRAKLVTALEDWWVRFDDVSRTNFGRKEAEFAVFVLDRWFGKRFFSVRRFLVCTGIMIGWWTFGAVRFWTSLHDDGSGRMMIPDLVVLNSSSLNANMLIVIVSCYFGLL